MPNDPIPRFDDWVKTRTPRERVFGVARSEQIPDDIAEDYLKVTQIESGHNVNVRKSSKGARGFGQVMPDRSGGHVRTVGGRQYDLRDPDQNITAGLRYFSEGGDDPVARRLRYFGGQKAQQRYQRTGRIPNISDGNMTAAQYVRATGAQTTPPKFDEWQKQSESESGFRQWYDRHAKRQNLNPDPDAPEHQYDYRAAYRAGASPDKSGHWPSRFKRPGHPNRYVDGIDTITGQTQQAGQIPNFDDWAKDSGQNLPPSSVKSKTQRKPAGIPTKALSVPKQPPIVTGSSGIGELRRIEAEELRREQGMRDEARQEIRARRGAYGQPTARGVLHLAANPVGAFMDILKSEDQQVEEMVRERQRAEAVARKPEVTSIRKEYGQMSAPGRAAVAPLARGGAGILKLTSGLASLGGYLPKGTIPPADQLSEWANRRSEIIETAASLPPLTAAEEEVQKGLPEKVGTALADLGVGIGQIILLKKATKLSFPRLLALEGALKASDKPLAEQAGRAAEGYALGTALDAHLGRPATAALFGVPTGLQSAQQLSEGRMSLEDALLQTGVQAGAGAILGGGRRARQVEAQPDVTAQPEAAESSQQVDAADLRNVDPRSVGQRIPVAPATTRDVELSSVSESQPQRFYHKDWGEVEVLEDQSGANKGKVKVAEVADPTRIHYPRRSDLRGRGNERMVPLKPEKTGYEDLEFPEIEITPQQFKNLQARQARAEVEGLEAAGPEGPRPAPRPAEQLGFVQEGLTQQTTEPNAVQSGQRERLIREEQDRQAELNPERTAALAKLEEIRRRGMTVDDYARQPDLMGTLPRAEEVAMLREIEFGEQVSAPDQPKPSASESVDQRIDRLLRQFSTEGFLESEQGGFDLTRLRDVYQRMRGEKREPVPEGIAIAAKEYYKLAWEVIEINNAISDAGKPDRKLSKNQVDALWKRHGELVTKATTLDRYIRRRGYKTNLLGETVKASERYPSDLKARPLSEKLRDFLKGEKGELDLDKLRERMRQLLRENPNLTDKDLVTRAPEPPKKPKAVPGWESGGGTTDTLEEMARIYRAKPEGVKGPPQPLPPLKNGVTPDQVQEAWDAVSARYPRIARLVTAIAQIEDLPGKAEALKGKRAMAAVDKNGVLWINAGEKLTRENAFHEMTHVAQRARKADWLSVQSEEAAKNRGLQATKFGPGTMRAGEPLPEVKERKFGKRFVEDERIADEIRSEIGTAKYYEPIPNKITAAEAAKLIEERGIGESIRIIRDEKNDLPAHIRSTMGQIVIQKLNRTYQNLKESGSDKAEGVLYQAVDLAEWAMDYGTRLGQGVQSYAMWARLTPEGKLLTFKRGVDKAIQKRRTKRPEEAKEIKEIVDEVNKAVEEEGKTTQAAKSKAKGVIHKAATQRAERAKAKSKDIAIWQRYKDGIARHLSNIADPKARKEQAPLQEFSTRLLSNVEKLITKPETAKRPDDVYGKMREVVENFDKYQEAWNEAVETIRKKYGDKSVSELAAIERRITDLHSAFQTRAFDRVFSDAVKQAEINFNELARAHYEKRTQTRDALIKDIKERLGIELTDAEATELAATVTQRLAAKTITARERILAAMERKNKTAKKALPYSEQLLEAARLGVLNEQKVYEVAAERLGLPKYDKAVAAKILQLAGEIEAAAEGLPRTKKVLELQKFIAEQKGFDVADLPLGIFYGNILSGYNTHAVNFADTGLNVLSEINGLALNNPQAAAKIYAGMLRGFVEGRWDAMLAMTEGRMFRDSKWLDAPGLMEVAKFGQKGGVPIKTETRVGRLAKRAAESKIAIPLNAYKYVSRAMSASDAVMARSAQEARSTLLAYRMAKAEGLKGEALEARVRDILAFDREADFEAQAQREGFTGKEAAFRAHELREMARPKDLTADAAEFAGEATYNHKPHGTLGLIAERIAKLSDDVKPLKLFVPFTRIVANVTNRGLNYTPYGYKRAFAGWGFGKNTEALTAEGRRLMLTRATMGTAGMVLLAGLEEAGLISIHGNGPSDREKRRQLQNAGWRPYTLQIGNTFISYVNSPVGLGLSILGNIKDSSRYHELEQKDAATRGAYAVARLGSTIFSQSFLSGLSRLFGALSERPDVSVGAVKQTLGGTVSAFTTPNIVRDVHRLFDNKAYQSNNLMEDMIRSTPFAALALKPQLNAFGEPVRVQRQRFVDKLTSDPAWRFVIEKGLRVPVPGRTSEIEGKRITPEQYYQLLQKTGPEVKQWILDNQQSLQLLPEQDAQDELQSAATAIRKRALDEMRGKIVKPLKPPAPPKPEAPARP